MDLTDIYRALHPNAADYTFFSSVHGTFSRIDHMLGHKVSLDKFKKTEIISSIFSDHSVRNNKIRNKLQEKTLRNTNMWQLNNMLITNHWITEEIKEEIKNYLETNENKKGPKVMGCSKSSSKREVYSNTILLQETRKTLNRQLNFTPNNWKKNKTIPKLVEGKKP